jgi:hypothetical protein
MKRKPYEQTLEGLKARCDEVGDCWIWKGAHDGKGRPICVHKGKRISPRRLARQLTDGREVQSNLVVGCKCGDIKCISPLCSMTTTIQKVHKLAAQRGVYQNAARDRRMVLTKRAASRYSDKVETVKAAASAKEAAKQTGMSISHAKAIRAGRAWRDFSNPFAGLAA